MFKSPVFFFLVGLLVGVFGAALIYIENERCRLALETEIQDLRTDRDQLLLRLTPPARTDAPRPTAP